MSAQPVELSVSLVPPRGRHQQAHHDRDVEVGADRAGGRNVREPRARLGDDLLDALERQIARGRPDQVHDRPVPLLVLAGFDGRVDDRRSSRRDREGARGRLLGQEVIRAFTSANESPTRRATRSPALPWNRLGACFSISIRESRASARASWGDSGRPVERSHGGGRRRERFVPAARGPAAARAPREHVRAPRGVVGPSWSRARPVAESALELALGVVQPDERELGGWRCRRREFQGTLDLCSRRFETPARGRALAPSSASTARRATAGSSSPYASASP